MVNAVQELKNFNEFLNLVKSSSIVVVKVKSETSSNFNSFLKTSLIGSYQSQVKCATIDDENLERDASSVSDVIQDWLKTLGLKKYKTLFSGYYLFVDNVIKGYHPVSLDLNVLHNIDYDAVEGKFVLTGAFFGLLHSLFAKDLEAGFNTFFGIAEFPEAVKIFEFFKERIIGKSNSRAGYNQQQKKKQQNVVKTELENAYLILGVNQNATIKEIKKARNKIMLEFHPDKTSDENTKYVATVNSAFDLIMKSRKK